MSPVPASPAARWRVRILVPGLPLQSCSVLLSREHAPGGLNVSRNGRNGHASAAHGSIQHVVVDTGFPQHDALLLDGLRRVGVTPDEVAGVINTHFHLDHFGSNYLFPRAWVFGSKTDYEWARSIYESVSGGETRREVFRTFYPEATDEEFDRMDEARVLQLLKWMWDPASLGDLARYRWFEEQPLPLEGVRVLPTPGHSPGHLSLEVDALEGPCLIAGDARPFFDEGAVGYDMPPHNHAEFLRSRELIDRFAGLLIPGHDDPFSQSPVQSTEEAALRKSGQE